MKSITPLKNYQICLAEISSLPLRSLICWHRSFRKLLLLLFSHFGHLTAKDHSVSITITSSSYFSAVLKRSDKNRVQQRDNF